jgi:hypothetical protein
LVAQASISSRSNAASAVWAFAIIARSGGEGDRPHQGGRGEPTGPHGLYAPHGVVPCGFDLEVGRRHVRDEARLHEVVGIGARLRAMCGRAVEKNLPRR